MFFKKFLYLEKVDSTNNYLKSVDKDRTVVWSYNQTKGRGRENRKWVDFKDKNLALSILFIPTEFFNTVWYIASASLAIIDTITYYGINNGWIKWPNDVYIQNKKLAGILAESLWQNNIIEKLIIGIGINVNTERNNLSIIDKEATSVAIEINKIIDIKEFTKRFIDNLSERFELLLTYNNIELIKEEWIKNSRIIGRKVEWHQIAKKEIITGIVRDVDNEGLLILESEDRIFKVISGDIILK